MVPPPPPAVPQTPLVQSRPPQQTVSRSQEPPLLWQQFRMPSESIPFDAQTAAPARLAALAGLRAFRAEWQSAGPVVRAETVHAVEAAAAPGAVVAARTGAAFVAAAIQRTVAVIAVVSADRRSATLAALGRRSALRPGSESARRRRSRRRAATGAVDAEEIRATLDVARAGAARVAAAVARAVGGNPVAGADDRSTGLAAFAGRRAFGAERPPTGACRHRRTRR